jgi:hypothetical protein
LDKHKLSFPMYLLLCLVHLVNHELYGLGLIVQDYRHLSLSFAFHTQVAS